MIHCERVLRRVKKRSSSALPEPQAQFARAPIAAAAAPAAALGWRSGARTRCIRSRRRARSAALPALLIGCGSCGGGRRALLVLGQLQVLQSATPRLAVRGLLPAVQGRVG